MKTVNWGIVGCGNVCERKSGPAMYKTPHSALAAVMRRDAEGGRLRTAPQRAEKLHRRRGADRRPGGGHRLRGHASRHAPGTRGAGPRSREARLRREADGNEPRRVPRNDRSGGKAGQKLFVAYYRRALPYFLKVKELLDGGSVGQPLTAEVRLLRPERPEDRDPARLPWRLRREVGGEGYFHDLAPHTLDILDFLLGRSPTPGAAKATSADSTTWPTPSRRRSAFARASRGPERGVSSPRPRPSRIRSPSRAARASYASAPSRSAPSN